MRDAMSIRVVPSGRGNHIEIQPAQRGSGGDQRRRKRDADHGPTEDVGALEQTPTPSINGHVDKLV